MNKKAIRLMKDKLGGKLAVLRSKTYSYLTNDSNGNQKCKKTQKNLL